MTKMIKPEYEDKKELLLEDAITLFCHNMMADFHKENGRKMSIDEIKTFVDKFYKGLFRANGFTRPEWDITS